MHGLALVFALSLLLASRCHLQAAIVSVGTATANNETSITSISFDDGRTVPANELIGITLTHFLSRDDTAGVAYPGNLPNPPATGARAALLEDNILNTGLLEIGFGTGVNSSVPVTSTSGLAFAFRAPVVNGPGDDVIIFEHNPLPGLDGNAILVSRVDGLGTPLVLGPTYQVSATMGSVRFAPFLRNALTLSDLENHSLNGPTTVTTIFESRGIAFDLSSLGYASGSFVDKLFLQTAVFGGDLADPTFIAGLPPVPEPVSGALLAFGAIHCLVRTRAKVRVW